MPVRVLSFYQLYFPEPFPFLQKSFTMGCRLYTIVYFVVNQHLQTMLPGKPFCNPVPDTGYIVLLKPSR